MLGRVNNTQPLWAGVLPVAPSGSTSEGSAATADLHEYNESDDGHSR